MVGIFLPEYQLISANYGDSDVTTELTDVNLLSPNLSIGEVVFEKFVSKKKITLVFETNRDQTFGTNSYFFPSFQMSCRKIVIDNIIVKRYVIEATYSHPNDTLLLIKLPSLS